LKNSKYGAYVKAGKRVPPYGLCCFIICLIENTIKNGKERLAETEETVGHEKYKHKTNYLLCTGIS